MAANDLCGVSLSIDEGARWDLITMVGLGHVQPHHKQCDRQKASVVTVAAKEKQGGLERCRGNACCRHHCHKHNHSKWHAESVFCLSCAEHRADDRLGSTGDDANIVDADEANVIKIMRTSGRERLELRRSGGREPMLLTYRVLNSHGLQQLVLFQACMASHYRAGHNAVFLLLELGHQTCGKLDTDVH